MTSFYVPLHINDPDRAISYHLAGMWANFAVSAALITWFVARLSRALRQRDAELASARERFLAQERMSALGMQAANAAHEMGTPLSTVAILAEDLLRETDGDAALARYREDFSTIEAQIGLCKSALQRLGASSGAALDTAAPTPIAIWLAQFMDTWRLRHPAAQIDLSLKVDEARIKETESAAQILTILLDNAAQAADDDALIRVCASCEDGHAMLAVIDNGPGITPDLLPRLGRQQVASSTNGQGIGLVLAFATARRIGANINLSAHTGGGTMATLSIPLA
jgi:two-component system sensor histidine kinase RegB